MRRIAIFRLALLVSLAGVVAACGGDEPRHRSGACSVGDNSACGPGMVCQAVTGAQPACFCDSAAQTGCGAGETCEQIAEGNTGCFASISVAGKVFDLATSDPIEGARVVARDVNDVPISGIAVTDANGHYTLVVPTPRNKDGSPQANQATLRADAAGYLTFPLAPRIALPVDVSKASGTPLTLRSAATDIGLIELQNTSGLGAISGKVIADRPGGTVVVAGGAANQGGGVTGVADLDGTYTVFNVPAGSVSVHGYKRGLQLDSATADVQAAATTEHVDLHSTGAATSVVSGSVEIVNPGSGNATSVILVVDETFNPTAARGEAPPGLRVGNVTNTFQLDGVPDGHYVVLAAFENDFLVRDPDTSIGGTAIVRINVPGNNNPISTSFKITGSLDNPSPDAEAVVSGTPTLSWADDSGEDHYEVRVFDAFGTKIWEDLAVPGVSGSPTVSVTYGGTALTSGMLYQFRAVSIKRGGTPLSTTEDLRGTFIYK